MRARSVLSDTSIHTNRTVTADGLEMSLLRPAERGVTAVLAAMMIVQSALGLLLPSLYRDVEWIAATWWGNDLVTLVLVTPVFVVSAVRAARGSHRARLVWLGVLGYGVYNVAFYLLGAALNVFFPIYVLAFVTAGAGAHPQLGGGRGEGARSGPRRTAGVGHVASAHRVRHGVADWVVPWPPGRVTAAGWPPLPTDRACR